MNAPLASNDSTLRNEKAKGGAPSDSSIFLVALAMTINIVGVFMKNDVALVIGAVLAIILVVLFEAPRVIAEKKQKDSKNQSSSSSDAAVQSKA